APRLPATAPSIEAATEAFRAGPAAGTAWPSLAHAALICIGIFLYAGARIALNANDPTENLGNVDPLNTLFQVVILAGSLVATALHWRQSARLALRFWPFLVLVAMMMASSLWSQSPANSFRRSLAFVTMMLFVASGVAAFGISRMMRLILGTVLFIVVASLGEVVLRPQIGFDTGDYANAIRGVFVQKNGFGMALLGGAMALSYLVLERRRLRWTDGALLLLLLAMLVMARSTTSLLLTMMTAAATIAFLWLDRGGYWMAAIWLTLALGAVTGPLIYAAIGSEGLFEILGKDSSLTGRVYIWAGVWEAIGDRPLLGYGYSAFWIIGSPGVNAIWAAVQWEVPTAHSGFLEVLLQLGWVGAGLVASMAIGTAIYASMALFRGPRRRGMWMLLQLVILLILNYSESALLNPDLQTVFWIMMLLALQERPVAPRPTPEWRRKGFVAVRA
uniref:O-antigen ligase family protein n=1 Tax=Roseomonas sp. 18066 TaxID=2681412 RepID=UPI00135B94B3